MDYNIIVRKEREIITPEYIIHSGDKIVFKPLKEVLKEADKLFKNHVATQEFKQKITEIINKVFTFDYVGYWFSPDNIEHSCCYFHEDYNKIGDHSYLILTKEMFVPAEYNNSKVQILFGGS